VAYKYRIRRLTFLLNTCWFWGDKIKNQRHAEKNLWNDMKFSNAITSNSNWTECLTFAGEYSSPKSKQNKLKWWFTLSMALFVNFWSPQFQEPATRFSRLVVTCKAVRATKLRYHRANCPLWQHTTKYRPTNATAV